MAPKVWVTAHAGEEGPAVLVGNQQVKAKAGSHIAPRLRVWRLCWKMEEGRGPETPGFQSSCVPLSGGLCQKQLRVLEGGIHHACLTVIQRRETRHKDQSPSPGLAPQTSRCIKKSQSPLSPFSGQSTGREGLPRSPESWWFR